ncbi:MAG: antibiotic biosynthesis monooxygenase family protein [Crocinitomicaceae bacterium]|nr:antibiotic biosynthesis monooxygenase family protein [Crocinitomicaceae bacterium]
MITRIVKLEFEKDKTAEFLAFFDTIKHIVNEFPGCYGMKLYQDIDRPNIIMTYSHWESQKDLDRYRDSEDFGRIWPKIKPWFTNKPEAWSVNAYFNGFEEQ